MSTYYVKIDQIPKNRKFNYLSNDLNNLKNRFYEGNFHDILIFTMFRVQLIKIWGMFLYFYIKYVLKDVFEKSQIDVFIIFDVLK